MMVLMAEPKLDPAYAVEMTDRERDALMQADDWAWMLERFFAWLAEWDHRGEGL